MVCEEAIAHLRHGEPPARWRVVQHSLIVDGVLQAVIRHIVRRMRCLWIRHLLIFPSVNCELVYIGDLQINGSI